MSNFLEYLKLNKNKSFEQLELNDIDIAIINEISYIPFEFANISENLDLFEIYRQYLENKKIFNTNRLLATKSRLKLLELVVKSVRFDGIILKKYINEVDVKKELQISVMHVEIPKYEYSQIVFRGTDDTLVGWKEDFNMTLSEMVPAQGASVKYLNQILERSTYPTIISGHSKGGNLAIYSSSFTKFKDKIKKIYTYDALGFHKEFLNTKEYKGIKNKIISYIPKDSFIGLIMGNDHDSIIVKSRYIGILQHNMFFWEVAENKFIEEKELSFYSQLTKETLNAWVERIPAEKFQLIVDTLFSIILSMGVSTFYDFNKNISKRLKLLRFGLQGLDKKVIDEILISIMELVKVFIKVSSQKVISKPQRIFVDFKDETKDKFSIRKGIFSFLKIIFWPITLAFIFKKYFSKK